VRGDEVSGDEVSGDEVRGGKVSVHEHALIGCVTGVFRSPCDRQPRLHFA